MPKKKALSNNNKQEALDIRAFRVYILYACGGGYMKNDCVWGCARGRGGKAARVTHGHGQGDRAGNSGREGQGAQEGRKKK